MEQKQLDMMERYIHEVVKRLPVAQREDVSLELRGLIEEMTKDGPEPSDALRGVLLELGNPADLADRYRGEQRHLIGSRFYDLYLLILKIVAFAVGIGMLISMGIGFAIDPPASFAVALGKVIGSLFSAFAQAFSWITVTFAIMERCQSFRKATQEEFVWNPDDLPEVPRQSALIPRSSPIASLVFLVLFFAVINSLPWFIRIANLDPSVLVLNPLVPAVFRRVLWLINLTIVIDMCIEFVRLYYGVHTKPLALISISLKAVSLGITLYIILGTGIWNPDFAYQIGQLAQKEFGAGTTVGKIWSAVPTILAVLSVVGYGAEPAGSISKPWNLQIPKR